MCQKQFGNFFGSFAGVEPQFFALTRGTMKYFRSSEHGLRGFCSDCGTPLSFSSETRVAVSIGSLDRHSEMQPMLQYGIEAREPWFALLADLPGSESGTNPGDDPARYDRVKVTNAQHPDHD
jgi:hypothetical protein